MTRGQRVLLLALISTLALLSALLLFFGQGPEGDDSAIAPKGRPPMPSLAPSEDPGAPAGKTPSARRAERRSSAAVRGSRNKTRPRGTFRFRMVNFDSRVFAEGIPRQGASVAAAPIRFDKDGYQESNDLFSLASTDQIRESKSRLSDESGFVRSAASCRDSMAEHESVGVAAYHPRYGSAYRELTLKELKEADDIELHLERGRAVSGQIVDEDSLPIENAVVRLSTSWKKGSISLDGLTGHTDVEGNYFIAGITGEANTVYGLTVREYENGRVQARASAPISSEMYNPQTRTWEVPPLIVRRTDGEPDRSSK